MTKYKITIDGRTFELEIERIDRKQDSAREVPGGKIQEQKHINDPEHMEKPAKSEDYLREFGAITVKSPMPGTVVRVNAMEGETVKQGQSILVLEAMKMENEITTPKSGRITALYAASGDTVQGGTPLFEISE